MGEISREIIVVHEISRVSYKLIFIEIIGQNTSDKKLNSLFNVWQDMSFLTRIRKSIKRSEDFYLKSKLLRNLLRSFLILFLFYKFYKFFILK